MRDRDWTAEAAGRFDAAVRASFGLWRIALRGERRAVSRALEPTESVLAVAGCGYEIVRHEVVSHRSMGVLVVVTDQRLIFAQQKVPFRPARRVEVTRRELRDGAVEVDATDRRVTVVAGATRITMRHVMGRDAVLTLASSIRAPHRDAPDDDEDEAPAAALPPPELPQPLGPGSRLTLVSLTTPGAYCLHQNDRVVTSILRLRNGAVHVSRAGRRWRLRVRDVRERLRDGRTNVAVMRGGDPGGEVELAAGITQVTDPILLVVMIVWATWLEAELGGM